MLQHPVISIVMVKGALLVMNHAATVGEAQLDTDATVEARTITQAAEDDPRMTMNAILAMGGGKKI